MKLVEVGIARISLNYASCGFGEWIVVVQIEYQDSPGSGRGAVFLSA
jgi:hypothetical protein